MDLPKLIDNNRVYLGDTLKKVTPEYDTLSIATGYWDLAGTAELIDSLSNYKSIRLLIGQEPISSRYQEALKLKFDKPDDLFPGKDFECDLVNYTKDYSEHEKLRETTRKLCDLINSNVLEVKIYRRTTLHAKTFIFGDYDSNNAVAILGSSNFTKAGLYTNTELNTTEGDYRIVTYEPKNETQENGYLTWFDSVWNDEECVTWTGDFKKIIQNSPVGNMTFGPYDAYIKTLMEIYPEELLPPERLSTKTEDILYSFQVRNAGILVNKLQMQGVAILADSVGLGKTITAGAVMKYYMEKNNSCNMLIIAPAALKQQWKDDLASILGIDEMTGDYKIVTQQDSNAIQDIYDGYDKDWRTHKHIDLFIIDEAHNLRSGKGQRHEVVIKLLQQHPDAHVLLLTATPINNSLMDLCNIIQLASRGKLTSVNVSYPRPNGGTDYIDFYDALKKIQSGIRKAENNHQDVDAFLETYKPTIHEGLRHYLVRSTRQGVEAEGGIIDKKTGEKRAFPKSEVKNLEYKYDDKITEELFKVIGDEVSRTFEQIDPRCINLSALSELTQQTCHPLDFLNQIYIDKGPWAEYVKKKIGEPIFVSEPVKNLAHNILQLIFLMGFVPYRPDVYMHKFWGKTPEELKELENKDYLIQFAVHNIMQITWLKRLESSAKSLLSSIENYEGRIALFEKYLDKGFIVSLTEAHLLESDYNDGEDIDKAFDDYDKYLKEREKLIEEDKDPATLKKYGVRKVKANPVIYNIKQIRADLAREHAIINMMKDKLKIVAKPENDPKIHALHDQVKEILADGRYGKKVLVFSFFADTINYLQKYGSEVFADIDPEFSQHAGFISGQTKVESIVGRFSPISKKYKFKDGETPINFLFSTDVLSEGQNLQDAGYLVNYDLHWNPVRMIQRNGRVNRLGSRYEAVLISNMKPLNELELYLNLVNKLERKIKTIRNTIGLDQGVLNNQDVNPIEFIEKYYKDGELDDNDEDNSILAHTDKHIIELRKYLGQNPVGSEDFERVSNIPLGKWNYLSKDANFHKLGLSFVRIKGTKTDKDGNIKEDTGNFFIEISQNEGMYKVGYINTVDALDILKAEPEDNERREDKIKIDRERVAKRVKNESERQYLNAGSSYLLRPQFIKALNILFPYLTDSISAREDIQGVIEKGVNRTTLKDQLERILKAVNKEQKDNGQPSKITIQKFIDIFHEIQDNIEAEKQIKETIGILNYARN